MYSSPPQVRHCSSCGCNEIMGFLHLVNPICQSDDVIPLATTTASFPVPGTSIELVHPTDGQGPLVKYLEQRGPGIHHLCFRTDDLDADVRRLKEKGYRFITDKPSIGAHNTRVIFIHPKSCDGVLIELNEYPKTENQHH